MRIEMVGTAVRGEGDRVILGYFVTSYSIVVIPEVAVRVSLRY
jgi:hypothetical protein